MKKRLMIEDQWLIIKVNDVRVNEHNQPIDTSSYLRELEEKNNIAKLSGSAWFCVGLCLATHRHKTGTQT